ncbi:MAG: DNA mismatch repair endonuclease MutL, partial [Fusicatenibacter sp.]|nr:DNA mismatch repair endonuclease MutL [Lachnospiraceae bacterium]MDY2936767.1 DNA mismatch repair endonuclease MutL [Fusicatenibacter sp.]
VPLAFLRHATSKIRTVEELSKIASLGFRGEALSSISAVSQVEMITKTSESLTGTRYVIEGGIEKAMEEVGAPNGTTFLVRNLFYNTPARQKFLRTAVTEANAVTQVVEQLALSHPGISFKYMVNAQTKLHTSGNRNLKELVYHIFGREVAKELIEVHFESPLLFVDGFIAKPVVSRGNRNFENYYVNNRYVRSKLLAKAIEDGYHTSMMQHKYPFTLLYIQIDGTAVDVNVHPTKMELRFSCQEEIYSEITKMIRDALLQKEQIVHVTLEEPKKETEKPLPIRQIPEPFEEKRRQTEQAVRPSLPVHPLSPSGRMPIFPEKEKKSFSESGTYREQTKQKDAALTKEEEALFRKNTEVQLELFDAQFLTKEAKKSHTVIGQVFDTYWLVQYEENLYIIDQHAAHEKILFERMMKNYREKEVLSQMVSPPLVVTLTAKESDLLRRHEELFTSFGYEISAFGGNEYAISAVPHNLYGIATEDLFVEILDNLEEFGDKPPEILTEKLASMSCKAAVKGNQKLSRAEVEKMIDELLELEDPYHCPHGRPTIISFSKKDLEKKFKRIV